MRRRRLLVAALPLALSACMGIDVSSVRRGSLQAAPPNTERAVAFGRIRFVVDGRSLEYHLLNKPTLQLFHRGRGQLMSTPETSSDGSFVWELPPGDYGVAVIHGGKGPARQPHLLPSGALVFVNGLVDPGLEFALRAGKVHYLGTLIVEIESAPQRDVLFGSERVFGKLLGLRVEDDRASEHTLAQVDVALMRVIERRTASK